MSTRARFPAGRAEDGFTLVELMWSLAIFSVLIGISMMAVRTYSLKQSLEQAEGDVVAQMNTVQARSVAQSNPIIFGIHFQEGTGNWQIVRFNAGPSASSPTDDTCTADRLPGLGQGAAFSSGTQFQEASFVNAGRPTTLCATVVGGAEDDLVFFFPRGSATSGSVIVEQPRLEGQSRTISVTPITGRVRHE